MHSSSSKTIDIDIGGRIRRLIRIPDNSGSLDVESALSSRHLNRWASAGFFCSCVLVLALGSVIAANMSTAGSWGDSPNNLDTARNIALGRGYVSNMVSQLAVRQPIPVPEGVRPPGLPYIYAGLFLLTGGQRVGAAVLLNTFVVIAGAFTLRAVIRRDGGQWIGDVVGALFVLSHNTYFIASTLNNGWLVLCTIAALMILTMNEKGRLHGWRLGVCAGLLAAIGFLLKQTMMLGFVPFGVAVALTDGWSKKTSRPKNAATVVGTFLLFTSPYWVYNIVVFGQPFYYPFATYRLYMHYELMPLAQLLRTVMFDWPPLTYADVIARIGWHGIVRTELHHIWFTVVSIIKFNPIVFMATVVALVHLDPSGRKRAMLIAILVFPVIADVLFALPEQRYMWPVWPLMLYSVWLGARARLMRPSVYTFGFRDRFSVASVIAAAFLVAAPLAHRAWSRDGVEAREARPAYSEATRSILRDDVVLGAHPWSMGYFLDRTVVLYPVGGRAALETVSLQYQPKFLLLASGFEITHDFRDNELILADRGADWSLYRILHVGELAP